MSSALDCRSIFLSVDMTIGARIRGGFRGGGTRIPAGPKGMAPLCDIHFWLTDHKIFLKAPLAPKYTNFKGEARRKNAIFWSKFSKKCLKTHFWYVFFFKFFSAAQKFRSKQSLYFKCFRRAQKKVDKIFEIFLKILPPSRKS